MINNLTKYFLLIGIGLGTIACDPQHLGKCEWELEEDLRYDPGKQLPDGWTSVCVLNRTTGRQKCFLAVKTVDFSKLKNHKIRYKDLQIKENTFPRQITKISACN